MSINEWTHLAGLICDDNSCDMVVKNSLLVIKIYVVRYILQVAECAKRSPELIQLLELHTQFAAITPYAQVTVARWQTFAISKFNFNCPKMYDDS
jgi:hypothetical protein